MLPSLLFFYENGIKSVKDLLNFVSSLFNKLPYYLRVFQLFLSVIITKHLLLQNFCIIKHTSLVAMTVICFTFYKTIIKIRKVQIAQYQDVNKNIPKINEPKINNK